MDAEWEILLRNNSRMSRFDQLKCRIAMASSIQPINCILFLSTISYVMFLQ